MKGLITVPDMPFMKRSRQSSKKNLQPLFAKNGRNFAKNTRKTKFIFCTPYLSLMMPDDSTPHIRPKNVICWVNFMYCAL